MKLHHWCRRSHEKRLWTSVVRLSWTSCPITAQTPPSDCLLLIFGVYASVCFCPQGIPWLSSYFEVLQREGERERKEGGHWDKDKECWWGTFIPLALIWLIVGLIFHEQHQRVACSSCYKMHHHWSILGFLWSFMNNVEHQCPRLSGDTSVLFRSVCAACMCVWGWKEQREVQWEQLPWLTHPPHETICYTEIADNPIL